MIETIHSATARQAGSGRAEGLEAEVDGTAGTPMSRDTKLEELTKQSGSEPPRLMLASSRFSSDACGQSSSGQLHPMAGMPRGT